QFDTQTIFLGCENPAHDHNRKRGNQFREWACEELNLGPHAYQTTVQQLKVEHSATSHRSVRTICPDFRHAT
ncbi:MAG: hypothetical protein M3Z54_08640, partial [Gemmatimonadota bacterium]|nr:hypothetical protein [Gemmatimonadota bacterium]